MTAPLYALPSPDEPSRLLADWEHVWRAEGRSLTTVRHYGYVIAAFAERHPDLLAVTRGDVQRWVAERTEAHTAANAAFHLRALRAFYRWLADEGEIEASPAAKVKTPKVPEPVTHVASADEVDQYLRSIEPGGTLVARMIAARDAAVVSVLWATGLRISELARLTWDDVDLDAGTVLVRQSKNGKSRVAPLDAAAKVWLSRYRRARNRALVGCTNDHVWLGRSCTTATASALARAMRTRARQAGVPNLTPHALRRGMAAQWLRDGGSQVSLQAIAGWSSGAMVRRYTASVANEVALEEARRMRG